MKNIISIITLLPIIAFAQGAIENPAANSTESGIGIISGWHCKATKVDALIDDKPIGSVFVGSERSDTKSICGKTATGYSLLINFNNLNPGLHNLKLYTNGEKFGDINFSSVKSGGVDYLQGIALEVNLSGFPKSGQTTTLKWVESKQNFVITKMIENNSQGINNNAIPLQLIMKNLANETKKYEIQIVESVNSINSTTYTGGGVASFSTATSVFEGVSSIRRNINQKGAVKENGFSASYQFNDTASLYFGMDYSPLGYSDSNTYCIASNQVKLPEFSTINQSGPWYDLICYSSASKKIRVGDANVTYSLDKEADSTALLKITTNSNGNAGEKRTTVTTYRVDSIGNISILSEFSTFSSNDMSATTETKFQ